MVDQQRKHNPDGVGYRNVIQYNRNRVPTDNTCHCEKGWTSFYHKPMRNAMTRDSETPDEQF